MSTLVNVLLTIAAMFLALGIVILAPIVGTLLAISITGYLLYLLISDYRKNG